MFKKITKDVLLCKKRNAKYLLKRVSIGCEDWLGWALTYMSDGISFPIKTFITDIHYGTKNNHQSVTKYCETHPCYEDYTDSTAAEILIEAETIVDAFEDE